MTDRQVTDRELWAGAAAGSQASFALLFDRHARTVYNHCFRLTASWSMAQDATQEAFVAAWRRRHDVRLTGDSALPWLLAVATNTVRNEWRSVRRRLAALRRLPAERDGAGDMADDVAGRLDDQRRMREIRAVVRRLPRAEREALELCVWAGVSYADAAVALGITEASVRSRVSRARSRLSRELAGAAPPAAVASPAAVTNQPMLEES
ncbi:MAG TPA: sigma-70 family RNA polymerase sigma factor [Pilimelia sp.]|nr:sigma-70 family RNA polymerase sigma factor [Pilimelia sp.]